MNVNRPRSNSYSSLSQLSGAQPAGSPPEWRGAGRAPKPFVPDDPDHVASLKKLLRQTLENPIDKPPAEVTAFAKAQLAAAEAKAKATGKPSTLKESDLPNSITQLVAASGLHVAKELIEQCIKLWDVAVKADPSKETQRYDDLMKAATLALMAGTSTKSINDLIAKANNWPQRPTGGDRPNADNTRVGARLSAGNLLSQHAAIDDRVKAPLR